MKKIIIIILLFSSLASISQSTGKVTGMLFFNFHLDQTKGAPQKSAFEIERALLGYDYTFNEKFSAKFLMDAGKDNVSDFTYFLRAFQLDYKATAWAKISAGMIALNQFNDQEKAWGYRYILKSYQDAYSFGTPADLGLNTELQLYKSLKMNLFVLNGEGFKKVQDLYGKYKIGGNLVYNPIEKLTLKIYYAEQDSKKLVGSIIVDNPTVSNLSLFAGFDNKNFRIGGEYNKMYNGKKFTDAALDHDLSGYSLYSTITLNDKVEFFGRFDHLESNEVGVSTVNWNALNDGNAKLLGVQYAPVKGIKTSLNYRTFDYNLASQKDLSLVYLNLELRF